MLESNQAKLEAKLSKYKEKCEALQTAIEEHQTIQAELHEKLKVESKNNSGELCIFVICSITDIQPTFLCISELTTALAKKDEKLKRREEKLKEESSAHEKLEKENSSLQTLNKRLETALAKKEKQFNEASKKLATFQQIQAQIFSLSKTVTNEQEDDE